MKRIINCILQILKTTAVRKSIDYCVLHKESIISISFVLLVIFLLAIPDILGACIYGFKKNFLNSYIQALRIYLVTIVPIFFLPGILGKVFFAISTIFHAFCATGILILYHKYRLEIGGDSYFILVNSNPSEIWEFLCSLVSLYNVSVVIFFVLFAVGCIYFFSKCKWKITFLHIVLGIILALPLSISILRYRSKPAKVKKVLTRCSVSKFLVEYRNFQVVYGSIYKNLTKKPELPGKILPVEKNIAGIIVIGESAYRKHHSIYGYPRNTTPNLSRRKDSILPFSNVISATVQTPTAIRYLLTDEILKKSSINDIHFSLPDLLKAAGYETHWISNQYIWGLGGYESSTTLLAQKCDSYYFVHNKTPEEKYDIACIKPVEKFLRTTKPVILFVHLMGSHIGYEERFPKNFGSFRDKYDGVIEKVLPANRHKTNLYDCSIEYTDFVLEKMIKLLEAQSRPSFLLYLSDHSECNGLDKYTVARATHSKIRACYEIPFLLWYSEGYKNEFSDFISRGKNNLRKPLQCDDAIWTIADITHITWEGFPQEKSLFSPSYKGRKRFMYNTLY